ncbi:hypothetical protein TRIATDRAFT_86119 [Trichoderma atroviride IMI 206040]|uniref:Uncharacterized protein n=1 Tax=Hypocrea atroviridis (strain ATCC 20476 / IMI 206040) TaxID=452589 RepID=G9P3T1_HYPAI|nr:uncharacterized protein TRIATDRAFT_86119 [Trichoderma atroviride IMI 206040]EHK43037.1 hypothetical protein TRIATDRAFT_86119 [Trichoderma atroviride IMI 206040]
MAVVTEKACMCVRGRQGKRRRRVEKAPSAVSTYSYAIIIRLLIQQQSALPLHLPRQTTAWPKGTASGHATALQRRQAANGSPKPSPQASYHRLLPFNQSQTRIPNARSQMPGTLAVMPFLGHDSSLIGHGLTSDKLAASMESSLSSYLET